MLGDSAYALTWVSQHISRSVLFAVLVTLIVHAINGAVQRARRRAWARQMGCGEVPVARNIIPGGLEYYVLPVTNLLDSQFGPWLHFECSLKRTELDFGETVVRRPFVKMRRFTYQVNRIGSPATLFCIEPENVRAVFATNFEDWEFGPLGGDAVYEAFGYGVITAERAEWARYRKQVRPHFMRDRATNLDHVYDHFDVLLENVPRPADDGWTRDPVDLLQMLTRFTIDTSSAAIFGRSVNCQTQASRGKGGQDDRDFATALDYVIDHIFQRARIGPLFWMLPTKRFRRCTNVIHGFIDRYVANSLHPSKDHASSGGSLLDHLVATTQNPAELRDQVTQLLVAGRNTTSNLIGYALLMLARHPEEYKRTRDEVTLLLASDTKPDYDKLRKCQRLMNVCNETLRLFPLAVVTLPRRARRDTILPCGGGPNQDLPVAMPKGSLVVFSHFAMNRRQDLWGPDADDFNPSRWDEASPGRKQFMPFSTGPRSCIGQHMALAEALFVIARMLQLFDRMEDVHADTPITTRIGLLTTVSSGVNLRLHAAQY